MTTKAPSTVAPAPENALEKIAYASVKTIPTVEPHDQDRLGYNVWRWLTLRRDPLEVAIKSAGARLLIPEEEAIGKIRENLKQLGVTL
ncbi:MAG: hypothetical protein HW412_1060 [Bacteroidetes bacterium]|nr:hypothetical protein [Bacteroidota bacterium]